MPIESFLKKKALTLLELIIAISIVAVMSLGIASLDVFSNYYLNNIERLSVVQNELAYVLEYMAKMIHGQGIYKSSDDKVSGIGGAVGDNRQPIITMGRIPNAGWMMRVFVDWNKNGRRDPEGLGSNNDRWVGFQFRISDPPSYQFWVWSYCPEGSCCGIETCADPGVKYTILSKRIKDACHNLGPGYEDLVFANYDPSNNYVEIRLGACYDPFERSFVCGTPENPKVCLTSRIRMPAVSTH